MAVESGAEEAQWDGSFVHGELYNDGAVLCQTACVGGTEVVK